VTTEAASRTPAGEACRRLVTTGKTDRTRVSKFQFVPLADERGAVIGGMMIARDVTDQRRAERQLLASRRQLAEQALADVAHFGLIAMRERVEALGGRFRMTTAPGQGTVVEARLPLTDPTEGLGT
jgi:hypothetical protein